MSCFSSGERVLTNSCLLQIEGVSYQSMSFFPLSVKSKSSYVSSQQGHVMLQRAGASSFLASSLALFKVCITHYLFPLL